jgi:HK97 family phage portal protein
VKFFSNLISRLRGEAPWPPPPSDDFWYQPVGQISATGMRVNADALMRLDAVMACVRCISEDIGALPVKVYRKRADGTKEEFNQHPIADLLRYRPNKWQTAFEFMEMLQGHLELRGNGYAQIVSGPRGAVDQLVPLHPDRVKPVRLTNGDVAYEVQQKTGEKLTLLQDEMFHLRGFSSDGLTGQSPIQIASEAAAGGIAAQDYANRFWANDSKPGSGYLEHPGKMSAEAAERLRKSWQENHSGANRHKVAVLEEGLKYHEVGVSNKDAQFLEFRKFNRAQVAALFRVPAHKIGETEKAATFASVEQFALMYVTDCIWPRVCRWEQAIARDLIIAPSLYFVEFVLEALERGDIKTRYEAYASAITNGWMTRNEVRRRENLNPLPGLDEPLQPLNMTKGSQPSNAPTARERDLTVAAAERVARKEAAASAKLLSKGETAIDEFYREHAGFMAQAMAMPVSVCAEYCRKRADELKSLVRGELNIDPALWEATAVKALTKPEVIQ